MYNLYRFSVVLFVFCIHGMAARDIVKDENLDSGAHSDRGGLWFGPRLGKRSLQYLGEDNSQAFLKLLEAADAMRYYYNQMPYEMQADAPQTKISKKVIFTPKLGRATDNQEKRYDNVEFTPRLGRKLPERSPSTTSDEDMPDPVMVNPRTNYFSPRLGRTFNFQPRLGRQLVYDYYPETQLRVARSINKTKET
ncbi:PBAN-type neuropeptides-like isoform X2 [Bicyclus anynana]|uniref:PBAN-type neuropeptides-like isoform X2 n=1 Tax=Bicyclus anynana TaxID=110368 RepID=A0A6J1NAL8_BICAN|nr:PBAN-type neuropeptides-like isoform X2 [Bicyclus anynana]